MFVVKCTITRHFTLVNNFLTKNIKFFIYFEKSTGKPIYSLGKIFSLSKHPLHNFHNILAPKYRIIISFTFMIFVFYALCL